MIRAGLPFPSENAQQNRDAPFVRNAGRRVTEAVIDDIAFISYTAGLMLTDGPLFEVAVIRHTGCRTGFLADADFRHAFATRTGLDESVLADSAVVDPEQTVAADVLSRSGFANGMTATFPRLFNPALERMCRKGGTQRVFPPLRYIRL